MSDSRMRPTARRIVHGLLGILCAAGCSDSTEPNRPPERRGAIPVQTLHPGESSTFDIADFFSDPDGDRLTYTAGSSHTGQATAEVAGSDLTISALAEGDPSVTVTATDPGGLFAAQSANVSVRLPNRAPGAIGSLPPVSVDEDRPVGVDVLWYFTDPDGDRLEYSATSNDPGIATVQVTGSVVTFTAVTSGATIVTVTATDPGGLSADQEIAVRSTAGPPGFRDDFDSEELVGWEIAQASAQVSEGVLQLTNTGSGMPGRAGHGLNRNLVDWQTDIRLGRAQENAVVRVVFHTPNQITPSLGAGIGSGLEIDGQDTNFRFQVFVRQGGGSWQPLEAGESDAISDEAGEFTELSVALKQMSLSMVAGGDTILAVNLRERGAPPDVAILTGLELWVVPLDGANERTGLFDWIEVTGTPVAGAPAADSQSRASGVRVRWGGSAPQAAPAERAGISLAPASAATPPRPGAAPRIRSGRWPLPGSRD